jgi:hypothetical protein
MERRFLIEDYFREHRFGFADGVARVANDVIPPIQVRIRASHSLGKTALAWR